MSGSISGVLDADIDGLAGDLRDRRPVYDDGARLQAVIDSRAGARQAGLQPSHRAEGHRRRAGCRRGGDLEGQRSQGAPGAPVDETAAHGDVRPSPVSSACLPFRCCVLLGPLPQA